MFSFFDFLNEFFGKEVPFNFIHSFSGLLAMMREEGFNI